MKQHKLNALLIILFLLFGNACKEEVYIPKPRAYHRIDMPIKAYQIFSSKTCPFTMQYPVYSEVERKDKFFNDAPDHPCWMNIDLPYFNGKIHLTYVDINNAAKLERSINDAYKYSMKHVQKADFIDETTIVTDKMSGKLFDLGGNVASSIQFYATDSSKHFLRGSLYFNEHPNVDSIRPSIEFIRSDIAHLMKSIQWN